MNKFKNRKQAGILLGIKLKKYQREKPVVLAIPRGGVPIAKEVASQLKAPIDIILSKKISHPIDKEYAIGAVSLESYLVNDSIDVSPHYIEEEVGRIRTTLQERYAMFHKNKSPISLVDKTVIIVDDGIATGYTIASTIDLVKQQKASKIIIAVPVAAPSAIKVLQTNPAIDYIECLLTPDSFQFVGAFYEDFQQVSDQEVMQLLSLNSLPQNNY